MKRDGRKGTGENLCEHAALDLCAVSRVCSVQPCVPVQPRVHSVQSFFFLFVNGCQTRVKWANGQASQSRKLKPDFILFSFAFLGCSYTSGCILDADCCGLQRLDFADDCEKIETRIGWRRKYEL